MAFPNWLKRRMNWKERARMGNLTEDPLSTKFYTVDYSECEDEGISISRSKSQMWRRNVEKCNKALLRVLKNEDVKEREAFASVSKLLIAGANPDTADDNERTALHHAVTRDWSRVCVRLLDAGADPTKVNTDGLTPFHVAFNGTKNDEIAAMLLAYTSNSEVRDLFMAAADEEEAPFTFYQLLEEGWTGQINYILSLVQIMAWRRPGAKPLSKPVMKTTWCVLDSIIDPEITAEGTQLVCYGILESDQRGRAPDHDLFDKNRASIFQNILKFKRKEFIEHDAIRLLIEKKWREESRGIFRFHTVFYILAIACLTYAAVLACGVEDPAYYTTYWDYSRGVAEILAYCVVLSRLTLEIRQIFMRGIGYFKDQFSLTDLAAVLVLLAVVPLRFTHRREQWVIFALGYFLWYIRLFHYAMIIPTLDVYVHILWLVLKRDLIPFVMVFVLMLFGFAATQMLANRWDAGVGWNAMGLGLSFPRSNASYTDILGTLGKSMFEPQDTVEYTGNAIGKNHFGSLLMLLFLFMCLVLFVNMLIAQITTTFAQKKGNALRERYYGMLWMIVRVELTSPLLCCVRAFKKSDCCSKGKTVGYESCEYVEVGKIARSKASVSQPGDARTKELKDSVAEMDARLRCLEMSIERLVQLQLGSKDGH